VKRTHPQVILELHTSAAAGRATDAYGVRARQPTVNEVAVSMSSSA